MRFHLVLTLNIITMTVEKIISKLEELAVIKKVMIDKSNFEQAVLIHEDERALTNQLEDLKKQENHLENEILKLESKT